MPKKTAEERKWERKLQKRGLSMNRGCPPRFWITEETSEKRRLHQTITVGSMEDVNNVSQAHFRKKLGKITPSGQGPE